MTPLIVRSARTRQVFADGETILGAVCAEIPGMADNTKVIARRLVMTREALGLKQTEFCAQIDVAKNVYNPFEKGARRITIDVALKIRARFGVSLDWIYCGEVGRLSVDLAAKLSRVA